MEKSYDRPIFFPGFEGPGQGYLGTLSDSVRGKLKTEEWNVKTKRRNGKLGLAAYSSTYSST